MHQKPPAQERIAGLDTLRAIAILLVMSFHLNGLFTGIFGDIARCGWMGVDLFFVLSGFLIGSQLFKPLRDGRGISRLDFYRNRAYRILPAYLVVLALYLLWPAWREQTGMSPLWEFLTFTENLFVDFAKNRAFSHAWSLCVEEHFYLLLPLIAIALAVRPSVRKTCTTIVLFVVFGLAIRSYEFYHVLLPLRGTDSFVPLYLERIYYPTYSRLDGLLAGVSLALVKTFRPAWWTALMQRSNWLLAAGAAILAVATSIFTDRLADRFSASATIIGFPLLALGFALFVASASDTRCWFARTRFPFAATLATLAYTLYLTHKEVAHLAGIYLPRFAESGSVLSILFLLVLCLAAAGLLHLTVERPFLALRDRNKRSRSSSTDPAASTSSAQ
jgi:peptidoglycan/LPS O-acetylase OafA/YrhL